MKFKLEFPPFAATELFSTVKNGRDRQIRTLKHNCKEIASSRICAAAYRRYTANRELVSPNPLIRLGFNPTYFAGFSWKGTTKEVEYIMLLTIGMICVLGHGKPQPLTVIKARGSPGYTIGPLPPWTQNNMQGAYYRMLYGIGRSILTAFRHDTNKEHIVSLSTTEELKHIIKTGDIDKAQAILKTVFKCFTGVRLSDPFTKGISAIAILKIHPMNVKAGNRRTWSATAAKISSLDITRKERTIAWNAKAKTQRAALTRKHNKNITKLTTEYKNSLDLLMAQV